MTTNYEKIKQMTIDEMEKTIGIIILKTLCGKFDNPALLRQWLESESEE